MRFLALAAIVVLGFTVVAADPITITGKVVDEAGQPIAQAEVWTRMAYDEPRITTESGADGTFRLQVERNEEDEFHVVAVAPGLSAGAGDHDPEHPAPVTITLRPESHVKGVVLDHNKAPLPGAKVTLLSVRPRDDQELQERVWLGYDGPVNTTTDEQGRYVIGGVWVGAEVVLFAQAEGFADWMPYTQTSYAVGGGPEAIGGALEDYTIELKQAIVIEGTVTHNGEPAAGVAVIAHAAPPSAADDEAVTDDEGRYRLEGLGAGTYNVMIDDLSELVAPAHKDVTVGGGETASDVDFELTPGGLIEGRVVDAETGDPVPRVQLMSFGPARPKESGRSARADVDENGHYVLRVAPGSNYVQYIRGPEDYPVRQGPEARFDLDVKEGEAVAAPDILLRRVPPLKVLVLDPEGQPVEGAEIDRHDRRKTDANGKCTLPAGIDVFSVPIVARHDERGLIGLRALQEGVRVEPTTIVMNRGASVSMRIIDPDHRPSVGVGVQAHVWADARRRGAAVPIDVASSGPDGVVRFENLPGGVAIRFSVSQTTARKVDWPDPGQLTAGEAHDLGDVVVDLNTLSVRGTVVLADQTPVEGALVQTDFWKRCHTDPEGRFELPEFRPEQKITILATSRDGKLAGFETLVPDWGLEPGIVLKPTVRVRARIIDAGGQPVVGQSIMIRASYSEELGGTLPLQFNAKTDAQGRVEVSGLVPGIEYSFHVMEEHEGRLDDLLERKFTPEADVETDLGDLQLGQ